jgi:serine/threonine protein kinase
MVDERGTPVQLGRGAMGITYKAFDVNLRCPVTLKVINERYVGEESARRRFLREARAAAFTIPTSPLYFTSGGAVRTTSTRWNLWKARHWRA